MSDPYRFPQQSSAELDKLEGLQHHNEIIPSGCQHVFREQGHPDGSGVEMRQQLCSLLAK